MKTVGYITAFALGAVAWEHAKRWYPWFVYKLFSRGDL